tara:strand:+ start:52 stop:558 length:507 start_codon:yes stop_codon:yes gene_type:complete
MNLSRNLKNKLFSKETIIPTIIVIIAFITDRVTKIIIINEHLNKESLFINNFLNIDLAWNTGIGFGLFSLDANLFYHLISVFIFLVIIFLFYLTIKANYADKILFSLIIGGALGNIYDRIVYFAVPDFIDFHINQFHWFTFNIADIFISAGVILIIIKDLIISKNEKN